jgi:hypothetical protein
LVLVPDKEPPRVFAGEGRKITVQFHNLGGSTVETSLRTHLYQASSATAASLGEAPWKELAVLPGQTVLDTASLTFPAITAETRFLVKWQKGTNEVIGTTDVLVYPQDLLKELKPLAGEAPLGVLDPQNQLKPLLKAAAVEYQDLENGEMEEGHCKLAILGPFQSKAQMRDGLPKRIKTLAAKGAAVVWLQPPLAKHDELKPSFYALPEGKGTVLVVQACVAANLADDPRAQLNLIELARLALHPAPLRLPQLTTPE